MPFYTAYGYYQNYTISFTDVYAQGTGTATGYATGYVTTQYLRLMKSVSGVITEVTNWALSTASTIASFRVKTSGTNVTVQAYTDANLTNQLGTDQTVNVAGATRTARYGVSLKPSSVNQAYAIASSVNITRN
jgi:hypothetical protein